MTSSILENKPSLAVEVTDLIRRMHRHILQDNCQHCRHILKGEAGSRPAPSDTDSTSAANLFEHHSKQAGLNDYNKFE